MNSIKRNNDGYCLQIDRNSSEWFTYDIIDTISQNISIFLSSTGGIGKKALQGRIIPRAVLDVSC